MDSLGLFRVLAGVVLALLLGCDSDYFVDGWDTRLFAPVQAQTYKQTLGGHWRASDALNSLLDGFLSDLEIDQAVDYGFNRFRSLYPELACPNPKVNLNDDYVMYVQGAGWAGGYSVDSTQIYVCLWSRGESSIDPGAEFIKRPPNSQYANWRFTSLPLCPAIAHELLHCVIGDPNHTSPLWLRNPKSIGPHIDTQEGVAP